MRLRSVLLSTAVLLAISRFSYATIDYSTIGATYTQDFNSLASSGTDVPWTNDATIVGWYLYRITGLNDPTPYPMSYYDASDGSAGDGRFYSYGADGNSERALGGTVSGSFGDRGNSVLQLHFNSPAGWIAASLSNNTGSPLTQFTLAYDGEQWKDNAADPQTMEFQYGFGASFPAVATWTSPGSSFSFTSPVNTGAGSAIDGNNAGRVTNIGGTITNLSWQPGTTLWLRWVELNDAGTDHALAIDNVSFSAGVSAVPEPTAVLFFGMLCAVIVTAMAGRRVIAFFHS